MTPEESQQQLHQQQRHVLEKTMPQSDADGSKLEVTPEGNDALRKGTEIYEEVKRRRRHILQPSQHALETKIGKDKALLWFGTFYKRMMADPRMAVLFNTKVDDANVSAYEHGKRLGLAIWSHWTDDDSYYHEIIGGNGGGHMFHRLDEAHTRAKGCPMRSKNLRGRGFTTAQRNSWLGHLWLAGKECNISSDMVDHIVKHLATLVGMYGPFVKCDHEA